MQVVDFFEFTQDIPKFFRTALYDEVIISNSDGSKYKLLPVRENNQTGKSPLEDIPRVTTQEIVEILQECRAGFKKNASFVWVSVSITPKNRSKNAIPRG